MNEQELERRLSVGEDDATEFKREIQTNAVGALEIAKSIVAFANSGGGVVLVGVASDSTVKGLGTPEQADVVMRHVLQTCQGTIVPAIWCRLTKVMLRGQVVLVVEVPGYSPDRPYRARSVYYVRQASVTREARADELARMSASANVHYDEQPVEGSTMADLERSAVEETLQRVYDLQLSTVDGSERDRLVRQHLRARKCISNEGVPTVCGLLFFAADLGRWLPDARITMARIPGIEPSTEFLDRQEIGGRLQQQIGDVERVLARWYPAASQVAGWERVDAPGPGGIPIGVLREAVMNAVTHRDYRAASQIRILGYEDRLEIVNPGVLLNQLTLENIRLGGISQRRNPVVASLLCQLLRRENLGIGVPQMLRLMRNAGLPEPEFSDAAAHFKVTLRVLQGSA